MLKGVLIYSLQVIVFGAIGSAVSILLTWQQYGEFKVDVVPACVQASFLTAGITVGAYPNHPFGKRTKTEP